MITLTFYCLAILVTSVLGGMLPLWLRLTHRWMEVAVSFVAGVMLGVALLHLLPHALMIGAAKASGPQQFAPTMLWVLGGFLGMFFVERFFCFHHHDVPEEADGHDHDDGESFGWQDHDHPHSDHTHDISWSGATLGLTLHSLMAGVALAAAVEHGHFGRGVAPAGFGTFLAILLHKPFDSMTIAMLMARGGWSHAAQAVVNAAFALAIPAGVGLAYFGGVSGVASGSGDSATLGFALAFSAGVFLCVSMSDLLPELQFHHHDRLKLSAALLAGLMVAYAASRFETHSHASATDAIEPIHTEAAACASIMTLDSRSYVTPQASS